MPRRRKSKKSEEDFLRDELLKNIKENHSELNKLLGLIVESSEDSIYRFYHQSFKAYRLQEDTKLIVKALMKLLPERSLNGWFITLIRDGTEKQFDSKSNDNWLEATRPILEAFFHARYFLEMAVKYGNSPKSKFDGLMDSGCAALLYLYNLR